MDQILIQMIGYLIIAMGVAMIVRFIHLPYTVGLVLAGFGIGFSGVETGAVLTHDFIFYTILPPLLFEGALSIHWSGLKRDMVPILVLSIIGVVVSALVVAAGMTRVLHWSWIPAMGFAVLMAATDPVAILAMFKDAGIKGRLRLLLESESLFNDGVAAVLFALLLIGAQVSGGESFTFVSAAASGLKVALGALCLGLLCGGGASIVAGWVSDTRIETTLTVIAAYGSFVLAERLHLSGVLATVAAGVLMGNLGLLRKTMHSNRLSAAARTFVLSFWEFAAYLANSLIFLLIGLRAASIPLSAIKLQDLAVSVVLVLLSRALAVYPLCLIFWPSRWAVSRKAQHVLWWGGLRGALAVALAVSLPESFPFHENILAFTFVNVVFSVVVQGLTMPLLLRKLDIAD